MEYAPGGDLFDYMKRQGGRFREESARWFYQQIVIAMDYCHKMVRDHPYSCMTPQ